MASRNYGMAYDTPYNKKLLGVLQDYNMDRDTNGEPDIFRPQMEGGAWVGTDGKIHTLPYHPHLVHPLLGSMARETSGGRFNLGRTLGKIGTKVAENVAEKAIMGALAGGSRPPGFVSPYVHERPHMVQSGTIAAYPVYNAVEMRALDGGQMCYGCSGGRFNFGKALGSIGKVVEKVGVPIASKVAEKAVVGALMGAGKRRRGRPRKIDVPLTPSVEGGRFSVGKTLGKIGSKVGKVAEKVGTKVAEDMAEKAVKSYLSGEGVHSGGVGIVKKPRGRPRKMDGGKFNLINAIKKVGKKVGDPFEKIVGVNPFTEGYDLGHDVIGPAITGKGVPSGGAVDGRKRRAEIVKKIMKEKGLKLVDASKYVKEHGLYK